MDKVLLRVQGMKCDGCESSVKSALESLDGVHCARADRKLEQVEIEFDPSSISIEKFKEIIATRGYTVKG